MGPRPDGRGRFWGVLAMVIYLKRQWGRDRMAAEGAARDGSSRGVIQRQWGRDRMAAEGRGQALAVAQDRDVNGAATGWPRKALLDFARDQYFTRQWGRDRMAAEGRRTRLRSSRPAIRQWGRDRMAAEGQAALPGRAPFLTSMGPRPDGRGRADTRTRATGPTTHVNGAATGWPRKAVPRWVRCPQRRTSMGPRPDGRGRRPASPGLGRSA